MDTAELLRGGTPFVVDTSAWWRFSSLPTPLAGLVKQAMDADRLWITPIVRMEILYSARTTTEYTSVETELDGFRTLRNDRAVADAAMSAMSELAEHSDGYHRVPLTDALIAAAAAEHGGVAVLHRDTHFDKLAEVLTFENVTLPSS
ncbi:MAG: PIN domain-containing protein [Solirubrobacterales bacterium]|nr:PIN domain-containing protein [Solirubrobacterales bacterium]